MSNSRALLNPHDNSADAPSSEQDTGTLQTAKKISLGTILGLAAAIALDTVSEILWKAGVVNTGADADVLAMFSGVIKQPLFIIAMLLFIPKYFNWMYVLSKADLTFAKPITSLSYITVLVFSAMFLNEPITAFKVIGLLLILCGVWQVSRTDVNTLPGESK